ncbi:hypothetical protein [Streptomyces sp. DSM 40750]|uniref:hypothetical protein n=1 Tax=Streptomyces sp. DSM 40750 TaxID=2801030 RepID=UPI00214AC40F|nr:hypothetical protein [Streptomyces sp. DSM 40750]UUU28425.1 hypothetical protein JIX55_38875 [Streptomyces sp. DSM 40750]
MLRDRLTADTRHVYFGVDAEGTFAFHNRTRDSRHDWQDGLRSPLTRSLTGHNLAATPYLRLLRDASTHHIHAQLSPDGRAWETASTLFTPFPYGVHAGVAVTGDAELPG